ncbi:SIMPL domain-containing protein [Xanthobacter sp. AM11]|uniref:SIMPL domain-containing protein n=1 Tax=Xanthobacter sp. AM11 TaxID=3380643 RepID=UPI0039BFDDF3
MRAVVLALLLGAAPVSAVLAQPVAPPTSAANPQTLIEAQGAGAVTLVPDIATVFLAIVTRAETLVTALDENSAEMKRLIAFCKAFGIAPADIRSGSVRIIPRPKPAGEKPDTALPQESYEATNGLNITVRELDRLGAFVRDAIDHGANRISAVQFGLADDEKATDLAREAAFADARRKAEHLAGLAHVKLGRVVRVTYPPASRGAQGYADLAAPTPLNVPVERGTITVNAEVAVAWAAE